MKTKGFWIIAGLLAACMMFAGCEGTGGGEDPALTGTVTINGDAEVGEALTANLDALNGVGTPSFQWKRAGSQTAEGTAIPGAAGQSYELASADEGQYISVTVTRARHSGSVTSAAVGPVTASSKDPLTGTVTISGEPVVGTVLTADTAGVDNAEGGTFSYEWRSAAGAGVAGTAIFGANGPSYTPVTADLGRYITVNVRNDAYSGSLTSAAKGPVTGGAGNTAELDSIEIDSLMYYFYQDIALPATSGGLAVTWESSDPNYPVVDYPADAINQNLKRVKVRDNVEGEFNFTLTAKVTKDGTEYSRTFPVTAREKEYYGYLLAYKTGNGILEEQLRYAISTDGYSFTVLNDNRPVIRSPQISRTGGIRDPYISRGHDGVFRMVCTDMRSSLGWNSNRGITMVKSTDLINWTHSAIHFPDRFPTATGDWEGANLQRVWAPEVIYDRRSGRYLVHFSVPRVGGTGGMRMFYSWANDDFTDLTDIPRVLYANTGGSVIDLSLAYFNNTYHGVIKSEGWGDSTIKLESSNLTGPYTVITTDMDGTSSAVEGQELYRLIGSDTWVYYDDQYGSQQLWYRTSTNLRDWGPRTRLNVRLDGNQVAARHGSVIPLTREEYDRLANNTVWMADSYIPDPVTPPVVTTPATLAVHYTFDSGDSATAITNRANPGTNNASVSGTGGSLTTTNGMPNFYTGTNTTSAYVTMPAGVGNIISGNDSYTIAAYVRIETATPPSGNGWFLWCFADTTNASQNSGQYSFMRAISARQTYGRNGYSNESNVSWGEDLARNRWYHVMYRESGSVGTIYINGVPYAQATHTINNTQLSGLTNNWLGRPCFSGDSYMQRTRYGDFRIYTGAVTQTQIDELGIPARLAQLNGD